MEAYRIDAHKLIYHPARITEWLKTGDCYPVYVEVGLTSRCNHRCIYCALDWLSDRRTSIQKEVMLNALTEMSSCGVKALMFAGEGEPLLHTDIIQFVKHAYAKKLKVAITTNGVLFDSEKAGKSLPYLSWIRFSVDTGNPEEYARIHQTVPEDLETVISNIECAAAIKKKHNLHVDIGVQALLLPDNIDGVLKLAKIIKNTGADNFQLKPFSPHPLSNNQHQIKNERYAQLEDEFKSMSTEDFKIIYRKDTIRRINEPPCYQSCLGLPFFTLINAKGDIIPCNLYYENQDFSYGNLNREAFSDIWKSSRRKRIVEKISSEKLQNCRRGCRLDAINQYLHRLKFPEPRDDYI